MTGQGADRDRRRAVRVGVRGRIVVHGDRPGHGKLLDLSAAGVRFRLAGPAGGYLVGQPVVVDLRFDDAVGGWWHMAGRITRIASGDQIAVAFDDVPTDFAEWVQAELVATLVAQRVPDVWLRAAA